MDVTITKVDQTVRQMTVTVDKETYEKDYQKALSKFVKSIEIKGFRKGKAPISTVLRLYGEEAKAFYMEEYANTYYKFGLQETNMKPVSQASFDDVNYNEKEEPVFIYGFETLPEDFEYEYENLTVEFKADEYNDDLLDKTISSLLEENAEEVPFEEGQTIEINDKITILEVGTEQEIPAFNLNEESLKEVLGVDIKDILGLKLSDKFTFEGKEYQIVDAFKKIVPELNDETAKILGHDDVVTMKNSIKANIVSEIETRNSGNLNYMIVMAFGEKNKDNIKLPKDYMLDVGRRMFLSYMQGSAEQLEKIPDDVLVSLAERHLPNLIWDIAFEKVAADHNITVSEEELDAKIVSYANQFNMGADEFKEKFASRMEGIRDEVLSVKVIDFIKPYCVIVEPQEKH
jgi:trigger factor